MMLSVRSEEKERFEASYRRALADDKLCWYYLCGDEAVVATRLTASASAPYGAWGAKADVINAVATEGHSQE